MERCGRKSIITTLLTVFACMLAVVAVLAFIPTYTKVSAEEEPGDTDEFVALDNLVYDREYTLDAINSLLAPESKKVTTETVQITAFNGSTENLPTSIYDAGEYTVTITAEEGESATLTVTIAPAPVDLAVADVYRWRVGNAMLSDGPVYIVDNTPTLNRPTSGEHIVKQAIESVVRVRSGSGEQVLGLRGTGFTAEVAGDSSDKGTAVGQYTTTYTLTADDNHVFVLDSAVADTEHGLTVTLEEDGIATVTKEWYIVDTGNWLVDDNDNDYAIANRVYGERTAFTAPKLRFGNTAANSAKIIYTLTRYGYDGREFTAANFDKYLNNTIPVGSYTLKVSAPEVDSYPAFDSYVTFEVTAATLSFDQGINDILNGESFGYILGETTLSEEGARKVNAINGAIDYIYRNMPVNSESAWPMPNKPVIEVNLVSDKTNVYADFNRPDEVGVYNYYYRIRIDNYTTIDSDSNGAPLGFTLAVYGVVDMPTLPARTYTGALQTAVLANSELYKVIQNDGGINVGTYSVVLELIHPECYIWVNQTLDEEHPTTCTVEFVIEQAINAWTRLPNIVNWSYDSFDADVNRIRAVPLYLDVDAEMYFKVTTDEEGTNIIRGLNRITVDRNGKVTDPEVIRLLNGLSVGRYYLVSVVDETTNYASMAQPISFNVTRASNAWASGSSDVVLPSWVVGDYNPDVNVIAVNPEHGVANIRVVDIDGAEYYNSVTGMNKLADAEAGKYLVIAWVDASDNFAALAERMFTIEVLETIGLPWWGTLVIVLGALIIVAIVILVLWKKGVFQILTGKLILAIRAQATADATIAAVRANKKAEEAKASVEAAKAKERNRERRAQASAEQKALPVEERAAALEAKAQAAAAKADKMRARADAMQARANRMKEEAGISVAPAKAEAVEQPNTANEAPVEEKPVVKAPESEAETQPTEAPVTAESTTEAAATADEKPKKAKSGTAKTTSNNRPSKKSGTTK